MAGLLVDRQVREYSELICASTTRSKSESDRQANMLDKKHMTNEQLRAQLDAMYASTSWRVTAPLRLISTIARTGRQFVASPRSYAKRAVLGLVRWAAPRIRRSPTLMNWVAHLRDRYPAAWDRFTLRLRPAIAQSTVSMLEQPVIAPVAVDPTDAWSMTSQAGQFKKLLAQELQKRKIGKSEHS